MRLLLDIVYLLLLLVLSPWLAWNAWRKGKYRQGLAAKLLGRVPVRRSDRPCIWLHAVSVGEVNLLAPVVDGLAVRHPELELVISTTTRTGYELAQRKYAERQVFYCPLDFSWAVRAALRRVRPQLLILAELELWPNLITLASAEGVRVAVINGRLSDQSWRGYRWIRPWIRRLLQRIDLVAVQSEEYASRFIGLGADALRLRVTGNLKFDGVKTCRANPATERLRRLAGLPPDDLVFLAGSTQEPEEAIAVAAFGELARAHPALRLIVCPRHPERFDAVARCLRESGFSFQRRAALPGEPGGQDWRILLVDSVGELAAWWGTADIAFVGGSLTRRGGQNMVEPAAFGAAVSFGPNTWNFRDTVATLLEHQAAKVVHDREQLVRFIRTALESPGKARAMGRRAAQVIHAQQGAADRTLRLLSELLSQAETRPTGKRSAA